MTVSISNKDREVFSQQLVKDFINKVTGNDINRLVDCDPNDRFFVGKLTTPEEKGAMSSSKQFIKQVGVEFIVKNDELHNLELKICPKGDFYYRVNPTLQEQIDFIEKEFAKVNNSKKISIQDIIKHYIKTESDEKKFSYEIVQVYNKFSINKNFDININIGEIYNEDKKYGKRDYTNVIKKKIDDEIKSILELEDIAISKRKVTLGDIESEKSWRSFIESGEQQIIPRWLFSIIVDIKAYTSDSSKISIYLSNETKVDIDSGREVKSKNNILRGKKLITTLFNSGLNIDVIGAELIPVELNYFYDDYKYDNTVNALGNNCNIEVKKIGDKYSVIKTSNIPIYIQKKLKTKDSISVRFEDLAENPTEVLNQIYFNMEKELKSYREMFKTKECELTIGGKNQFLHEINSFEFEIKRFKNAIRVIENYDIVNKSFKYMNKAFSMNSKGYDSWRLFQIVFIVSMIPDICASEYKQEDMGETCKVDDVDVLYFPTGGGKTEAFLGTVIFTMFFDRFRNKNYGISSIIKYPLRLLSVQQVQRVADIMAKAEIIRQEDDFLRYKGKFSLGYYVGDSNTPNKIDETVADKLNNSTQEQLNNNYKIIEKCPFCGYTEVDIEFDKENLRLKHICKNKNCSSKGEIPLYIVDREIYRYLPTVIISTIDKIAAIGYQPNFKNLLGQVKYECPQHGYTSKDRCTEGESCKFNKKDFYSVDIKDPAPTLLIQDELHLVMESLGAFDSHYETLFQHIIKELNNSKKIKIIGATATISQYEYQLKHLYGKDGIRFPCETPSRNENFYSFIDEEEINRIILGYAPYAKSVVSGVVYSMKYLKQILWYYYKNPQNLINIEGIGIKTNEEAFEILKDYWFLLEYNNVKQDGNRIIGAINTPINEELKLEEVQLFDYRKMTGDDTFQDVRKVLFDIENTKNIFEGFNLITATSMISHGVDADRFNNMIFFGMPGNTAEYIQAYSRVGRKYPGIVIVILRPSRDKDMSYLRYFSKFHEFKDILVDPVPINRWASKSIYKTLPGIIQAIMYNYYEPKLRNYYGDLSHVNNIKKAIHDKQIPIQEFLNHVLKSYTCISEEGKEIYVGKQYTKIITERVELLFKKIENTSFDKRDTFQKAIRIILGERVMTSLRDSENQVKISLD